MLKNTVRGFGGDAPPGTRDLQEGEGEARGRSKRQEETRQFIRTQQ